MPLGTSLARPGSGQEQSSHRQTLSPRPLSPRSPATSQQPNEPPEELSRPQRDGPTHRQRRDSSPFPLRKRSEVRRAALTPFNPMAVNRKRRRINVGPGREQRLMPVSDHSDLIGEGRVIRRGVLLPVFAEDTFPFNVVTYDPGESASLINDDAQRWPEANVLALDPRFSVGRSSRIVKNATRSKVSHDDAPFVARASRVLGVPRSFHRVGQSCARENDCVVPSRHRTVVVQAANFLVG